MTAPRKSPSEAHPSLSEIAAKLENARPDGAGFLARCLLPERHQNGDAHPTMGLFTGRDGRPRLHCPVCGQGSTRELMAEAGRLGILPPNGKGAPRRSAPPAATRATAGKTAPVADSKGTGRKSPSNADKREAPLPWKRPVERTYDYGGGLEKVRFADQHESRFAWRQAGPDGRHRWNRKGHELDLYGADALPEAIRRGETILYCAGERDVETASQLSYTATCAPDGEGSLSHELADALKGATVAVIPDADKPGREAGQRAASILHDVGAAVRVVELPGLTGEPGAKDLSDWLVGRDPQDATDQLDRLLADAPEWTPPEPAEPEPGELPEPPTVPEASPGRGFALIRLGDLQPAAPEWIVRPLIETDALGLLFADPGAGKSFLALDWAASIATGSTWGEYPVKQGPAIYVAGEGRTGLLRRARAWENRHQQSLADAPLYLSNGPAQLCNPDNVEQVAECIAALATSDAPPLLIVIDTLARNFGGGDENSTQDMNAVIAALDGIRLQHKCSILLVHHTGHADKTRARGAMALQGAVDFAFGLTRGEDGLIRMAPHKMKEAELPEPMAFRLRAVETDVLDQDGQPVNSAVLDVVDYVPEPKAGARGRGRNQTLALSLLHNLRAETPEGSRVLVNRWKDALRQEGLNKYRIRDVLSSLQAAGHIWIDGDFVEAT